MAVEPPLVGVKLTPPTPPSPTVPRPRLEERLATHAGGALTLVTGPTGAGKTALLAAWYASVDTSRGWVSFDRGDNDPVRFWSYVVAALRRLDPDLGSRALVAMRETGIDRRLLASLLEDVAELRRPATLMFDDFQVIEEPSVLESLSWAVEHLPPQLHLVIASRTEPPFRLPRLRVTGLLHEVREADLRFRLDEAQALLDGLAAGVGPEDAAVLTSRTEGWAAGLQLAGLSLREHPDPSGFVRRFAGSTRVVADLLVDEVLDRQSPEVRDFLLRTSVLDRFSGDLCDAVTGRRDSARLLHELEEANLFVVPLDDERHWYRYHQLFGDLLRSELRATDPEGARRAHVVAGAWYEAQGHASSAIRQHLAAGAPDRAWGVVVGYYAAYYLAERHGTIRDWLRAIPPEYLATDPTRSVEAGIAALLAGDLEQAAAWTATAQQVLAGAPDDGAALRLALLRGLIAWHRGDPVAALEDLERVRGGLGDQWWPVLGELDVALLTARAAVALGDLERADATLADLPPARRGFDEALVLILRAHLALAAGELQQVEDHTDKARAEVAALDQPVGILLCDLAYLQGNLHLERGRIGEAATDLEAARAQALRAGGRESIVSISVALARAQAATGRSADARTTLRRAEQALGPTTSDNPLAARLTAAECRLSIAAGRFEAARHLVASLPAGPGRTRLEVRLHLGAGRPRLARPLLAEVTGGPTTTRDEITDELLTALVLAGQDRARALEHVARAVEAARPDGYVQVFVDEGPEVLALLHELARTNLSPALHDILRTLDAPLPPPRVELPPLGVGRLVEPLSDRELGVLRYLPSPLPYREIASELYISPNTLKTHMRNLYRKLEVGSRSGAVARARDLHLL